MFSKTGPKWCDLNSLPAAPTAVEETVALGWGFFFFPPFNFIDLDGIITEEIIPGTK